MGLSGSKINHGSLILQLAEANEPLNTPPEFWDTFWALPALSVDEWSQLLNYDRLRELKKKKPHNLGILIKKCVEKIASVTQGTLPHKQKRRLVEAVESENWIASVLNAIRIITRVMPVVFEDSVVYQIDSVPSNLSSDQHFHENLFWRNRIPNNPKESDTTVSITPGNTNAASTEEEIRVVQPAQPQVHPSTYSSSIFGEEPLGVTLINSLIALAFIQHFTVSPTDLPQRGFLLPLHAIWAPGVGVTEVLPSTTTMMLNRTEVLRCLLVCLSQTLYINADRIISFANRWIVHTCCSSSFYSLALFYSMINAAFNYDPIGWGIPYNHLMFADYQEELADLCLQIVDILINYNPNPVYPTTSAQIPLVPSVTQVQQSEEPGDQQQLNTFIYYLRELNKPDDFAFILHGIAKLLNNPIYANNTYLPNSTKQIGCYKEILVLLWRLLQENKNFRQFMCVHEDLMKVIMPILHFIYNGRKESGQLGTVHLCSFILLLLSGERDFGVSLNRTYVPLAKLDLPTFVGSYADFMILIFYKLFTENNDKLEPLYECLLTTLANISPYVKTLSLIASTKILNLFDFLSKGTFIFASERNYRYLFFVIEVLINIIDYQYEGNSRLIYAVLRHQESFFKLANLTISDWKPHKYNGPIAVKQMSPTEPINQQSVEPSVSTSATPENAEDRSTNLHLHTPQTPPPVTESKLVGTAAKVWIPTEEWMNSWKLQLPLATPLQLIDIVTPRIKNLVTGSATDEAAIIQYLQSSTLVGLLPVPHPIVIRKYQSNEMTDMWLWTYIFGVTYMRNHLFYGTNVKLFPYNAIKKPVPPLSHTQPQPKPNSQSGTAPKSAAPLQAQPQLQSQSQAQPVTPATAPIQTPAQQGVPNGVKV